MDVKSTWIPSYMALNGSCFMITWTIFKDHFVEAGLRENRETMTFRTLTTLGLVYFIMCEDPHDWKFIEIAYG